VWIGGSWVGLLMGICGIGSITVIILLVIFGVTGKVSGGMLALGWLLC